MAKLCTNGKHTAIIGHFVHSVIPLAAHPSHTYSVPKMVRQGTQTLTVDGGGYCVDLRLIIIIYMQGYNECYHYAPYKRLGVKEWIVVVMLARLNDGCESPYV